MAADDLAPCVAVLYLAADDLVTQGARSSVVMVLI